MDAVHIISAVPTLDTSPYATGDALHAAAMAFDVSSFRDLGGVLLEQVLIADKAAQAANLELVLFNALPADQTFNVAYNPSDAESFSVIAVVPLTTHFSYSGNSITVARNLAIPIKLDRGATSQIVYGCLVSRGSPTYAAASLKAVLSFRSAVSERR